MGHEPRVVKLPPPRKEGPLSLEETIARRRSCRLFSARPLDWATIGQLLWAAQGITGAHRRERAAPSAGARHPLELYLCTEEGVWHYRPERHTLLPHHAEDIRAALAEAAWRQDFIAEAPVVLAMSAVYRRSEAQYGKRARLRYVPMDAGHAAENLLLQAVALGLGAAVVGAFDDGAVKRLLRLPADEEPLYLIPVGYPL